MLVRVVRLSMVTSEQEEHPGEQEEHIACQVRKGAVAGVVLAPAPALLVEQRLDTARIPGALGVFLRESVAILLEPAHFVPEVVDLAAGTGLAAIEAAGVEEEGTAHLLAMPLQFVGGHCRGGDQGVHPPVDSHHPLDVPQAGSGRSAGTASARSRTA
jgi:hypothetical protein